jgi:SAM-dependent methyltransferase
VLERLERLGKRAPGVVHGLLGRRRVDALRARLLARSSKRLDVVAAQLAHLLHLARVDVRGRVALELGSGWVLSHAVALHLVGARAVIASDLEPQAQLPALGAAIRSATSSIVRDVLSPFEDHAVLRERVAALEALAAGRGLTLDALRALGVEYVAPLDLARRRLGRPVDLVYSNSVLEHVPARDAPSLLSNVAADLAPGGVMLHAVHLEDHRDAARAPFAFLGERGFDDEGARGNRLRASAWRRRFAALPGLATRELYAWRRDAALVPGDVDPSLEHEGLDDLRTSHVAFLTTSLSTSTSPVDAPSKSS